MCWVFIDREEPVLPSISARFFVDLPPQNRIQRTMELSKNFEPASVDNKWYQHCLDKGYFNSTPMSGNPIPWSSPPNVTGVLHMGHCLNNTIRTSWCARARMQGQRTHAGYPVPIMPASPPKPKWWACSAKRDRQIIPVERRIPAICLGMERKIRRHHPAAVEKTGLQPRLEPHFLYHGR